MKSGKVLRNEEKSPGSKSAKNPHAVANVNQPQGPRVGNEGAHQAKRGNFKAAKEERAPLADFVERAFASRGTRDKEETNPGLEPVSADSKRRFKK